MAKGNAIVMYLEQARIHGEPIGVTHSEVLFTKPNGYTVQPHNRVVSKADNKTMGESFLNELIYVLGAEDGEERKLPYDREVLVYTSDEINSDNYRTYINAVNTGINCPVHKPDIETEIELETEEPELSVEPKQESAETDSEPPAKKEIAPKPAGMESDQNGKKDKTPSDTENPVKVNAFTKQENPVPVEEKPAPKQKPAKASKAKTPKTPESGTSKPATAPAPAPAKKPEADNRNDASLFGRGFQNRTTKGSGGGKKKANQSKKPELYSEGEQMRFDGI